MHNTLSHGEARKARTLKAKWSVYIDHTMMAKHRSSPQPKEKDGDREVESI